MIVKPKEHKFNTGFSNFIHWEKPHMKRFNIPMDVIKHLYRCGLKYQCIAIGS